MSIDDPTTYTWAWRQRAIKAEAESAKLRAALERSVKFIRLGNHPNAGDMLDQIDAALNEKKR